MFKIYRKSVHKVFVLPVGGLFDFTIIMGFNKYAELFDFDFIKLKIEEGMFIKDISKLVHIPPKRLSEMVKYHQIPYSRYKFPENEKDDSGLYYVYRHRRNDDHSIFYIGLGNTPNHSRARSKFGRNDHWKNIVNKCGFTYEILKSKLTQSEACELEVFLIELYGRYDLKEGKLVNKTEGGEGVSKYLFTKKDREKMSENSILGNNNRAKKVIDTKTKEIFNSIKEASFSYKIPPSTMRGYINGNNSNKTYCVYLEDYLGVVIPPLDSLDEKLVINLESGVFHTSISEACICYNIKITTLSGYLNGRFKNKTNLTFA